MLSAGSLPAGVSQVQFVTRYLTTLIVPPHTIDPLAHGILLLGLLALFFQWKSEAMVETVVAPNP